MTLEINNNTLLRQPAEAVFIVDEALRLLVHFAHPQGEPSCIHLSSTLDWKPGCDSEAQHLYIGDFNDQAFSLHVHSELLSIPSNTEYWRLRDILGRLNEHESALASRALQLRHWLESHQYCGYCGKSTDVQASEYARICERCQFAVYPRISPCVIGVVRREQQLLLVNGVTHNEVYSAVAGFIEAGENAEAAFVRELREEVGIEVFPPQYVLSQSWPFPGQLMLGYIADYKCGDLKIDRHELKDARWFDRAGLPSLPPNFTIARKLIDHVLDDISE